MRPDADPRGIVDDLLELYAIEALEADETQLFENALLSLDAPDRAAAVGEIRGTRDAVGRMAVEYAAAPSIDVRTRLLDAISGDTASGTRPTLRSIPSTGPDASSDAQPITRAHDGGTDELSVRRINRRRRMALAVTSAAAAIVLVVGGVFIGRSLESSPPAPTTPPIAQVDPLDQLRTVMSAQDAEMHRTKLTGVAGTVVVASSRKLDTAVVLLDQAPSPPDQRTYQLWLIGNSHDPRSAGLVAGSTSKPVVIRGLSDSRTIGMTVEPDGGSPQPTGDVLAAVSI